MHIRGFNRKWKSLSIIMALFAIPSTALGQIPTEFAKYVNTNTGSFQYSIPLVQIPSPDGPTAALSASYSSGIKVEQDAGLIGLGWGMSIGEIARIVNGVPDDFKGIEVKTDNFDGTMDKSLKSYGPMYFDQLNSTGSSLSSTIVDQVFDLFENEKGLVFPNYDDFMVQTPFLTGRMRLSIHETGKLKHEAIYGKDSNGSETLLYDYASNDNGQGISEFTGSKTVMRFEDEKWEANPDKIGKSYGVKHVEYFTNGQINGPNQNDILKPVVVGGLDVERSNSYLIGGIVVTDEAGYQYHFALPVYSQNFQSSSYPYQWNSSQNKWEPKTNGNQTKTYYSGTNTPYYAVSWKLTAIIGPDFKDLNNNNIPDAGDRGYWVNFEYAAWASLAGGSPSFKWFKQSTPYTYGSEHDHSRFQVTPRRRTYNYKNKVQEPSGFEFKLSRTQQESELYYPDKIVTASHAACFFYNLRKDGHSFNTAQAVIAKPRLSRILLVKSNRLSQLGTDRNLGNQSNSLQVPHSTKLGLREDKLANYSGISSGVLQGVVFEQDYSLCPGIPNHESNWSNLGSNDLLLDEISPNTSLFKSNGSIASGGKLTLKKVKPLGVALVPASSPHEFTYGYNPGYDVKKVDRWGYYHSGKQAWFKGSLYESNTASSAPNTKAWSITRIDLPRGSHMEVEYESNSYTTEWGNDGSLGAPSEILFIQNFNDANDQMELYPGADDGILGSASEVFINIIDQNFCSQTGNDGLIRKSGTFNAGSINTGAVGSNNGVICSLNTGAQLLSSCPGASINNFDYGYMQVRFNELKGYGCRVKSITIEDNGISGTDRYKTEFEYEQGLGVAPPSRFVSFGSGLRYNNSSASFISLPSSIYYLKTTAKFVSGYGTSNELGSVAYSYKRPFKTTFSSGNHSGVPGRVFIPSFYSQIPMIWLNDSILAQSSAPYYYYGNQIPDIIVDLVCNSNMDAVGHYSPISNVSIGEIPFSSTWINNSGSSGNYYDENGNQVLPNANGYIDYYTDHYSPSSIRKSLTGAYYVGGYGLLASIVTFNAAGQAISTTKYKYDAISGTNFERFPYKLISKLPNPDPDIEGVMSLRTDVVIPKGVISWSDGGLKETTIVSRNKYGQVTGESTFTSGEGTVLTSTEYMHEATSADNEFRPLGADINNGNRMSAVFKTKKELLKTTRPAFYTQDIPDGSYCLGVNENEYGAVPIFKRCGNNLTLPADYPKIQYKSVSKKDCNGTIANDEQVTLIDHNYRPIELYNDVTESYTAIIRDYEDGKVIATVPGARYGSVGISGFEYTEDRGCGQTYSTGINIPTTSQQGSTIMLDQSHTGNGRLGLKNSSGQVVWTSNLGKGLVNGKTYRLSVWVKGTNARVRVSNNAGSDQTFTRSQAVQNGAITASGWTLIDATVFIPSGASNVNVFFESPSGESYFDDFRFYPAECSIQVTYPDRFDRTSYILDELNLYTRYQYSENVTESSGIYQYTTTTYRETPSGEKIIQKDIVNAK